jgi:glyoxylase-like metal-dependent hydrolase (beta-lactamase superfamily II)
MEEIYQDLFRIKIPLPGSPLKYLNSYLIRSQDRNLIIDTGFNSKECYDAMMEGLNKLSINLNNTDIFVTHFHADHFSLIPKLKTPTTRIFFNRLEAELLENWQGFGAMLENADLNGFPGNKLQTALDAHPGSKFGVEWTPEAKILSQGQKLSCGDYTFDCIETPGHTMGHICLYEPDKKILISGDHVLNDITPNIQCWNEHDNPLKDYMASLEKIRNFDVDLVLPGHRRLFKDLNGRCLQLISHHKDRLDEICNILDKHPGTAYEVAGKMHWDIKADSWNDFPISQQWFATGEALSHLRYLERKEVIKKQLNGDQIRFTIP